MKNHHFLKSVFHCPFLKELFLAAVCVGMTIVTWAAPADKPFAVSFTLQPTNKVICENANTNFAVTATGSGSLTYQWQVSTNGGSSYSNVIPSAIYSGVTNPTLQITGAVFGMNSFRYQCVVTDASGSTASAAGLLTVNPAPVVQTGNTAITICSNGGGSLTAQFFATHTYQWEVSSNNGSSWSNVIEGGSYAGSTTDVLTITSPAALNGNLYRYVASLTPGTGCQATSGIDTLHVLQPVISTQPTAATICAGTSASFTAGATSPTALTYQWQLGTSNISNGATYGGVTTTTLTVNNPTAAMDRQLYRVVVKDTLPCTTISSQVRLFVLTPPSISTQPQNVSTCAGVATSFTVNATAGSTSAIAAIAYQWQTDNGTSGATWTNIGSGTTSTLSLPAVTMAMDGYRYRVSVSVGSCGSVTSSEGTLSVRSSGTWLGAVDTNWHVAGNWCGGVPVSTTDVLIPNWAPRMPTISNATGIAYSRSLTIENTAKLTIYGGSTTMTGPFDIQGTVAYTAPVNQSVLPADHGSLEINGSGNKILQINTGIVHNMVLGGSAKLVTSTRILTMKDGSNPIGGASFSTTATSWIVTGNGASGAVNTGLGGLRFEQLSAADGNILFPIGPTSANYNPARFMNSGTSDNYTMAVNDQTIPGAMIDVTVNRTWLISEAVPGGSNVSLALQWNNPEEQTSFSRVISEIIRSDGLSIVEKSATAAAAGSNPYTRSENAFVAMSQFSVATYVSGIVLPVKLISFRAQRMDHQSAMLLWQTDGDNAGVSYIIERSEDGIHYSAIGTVKGETAKASYDFTDSKTGNNVNWYRLHVTAAGKDSYYSRTIQLINDDKQAKIGLRPSVTDREQTILSLSLYQKEDISITILDVTGRVYSQQSVRLAEGTHLLPLKIGQLARGIYYVRVAGSQSVQQVLSLLRQ